MPTTQFLPTKSTNQKYMIIQLKVQLILVCYLSLTQLSPSLFFFFLLNSNQNKICAQVRKFIKPKQLHGVQLWPSISVCWCLCLSKDIYHVKFVPIRDCLSIVVGGGRGTLKTHFHLLGKPNLQAKDNKDLKIQVDIGSGARVCK